MNLTQENLQQLADIAIRAAKEAGEMIAENAGKEIAYEKKETGASLASQVVTEVDQKSQNIILKHILPTLEQYDLGLLTEESEDDGSRFIKDYFWSIDPMDGTLPFIESRPGYAVSIGFVRQDGKPIIGVVFDPLNDVLYHAVNGVGAFRNNEEWTLLNRDTEPQYLDRGGAVMNACWILENPSSYYFKNPKKENGGGCVWDYAASACIYEAIGAWVSDIFGDALELNRQEAPYMNHKGILFASDEQAAKKVLKSK